MCTQYYHLYQCGCRQKGEFVQCDRLYNSQSNLQCSRMDRDDKISRNYCPKHLPKEDKATTEYRGRYPRD
ncbi:hypothetical protein GGS23DRAFT_394170 [Durotheca rogersii]|uniref:uncharacterized protein n=1 Tax=Durotheca rogersii TaxID=419775 RepID=UPI00221E4C05|nr:uncharacterized protein GGS23DRAFT_394170 [Durotheca rogersii]KAI5856720.1 hypothetical protein GGS23DRAFT_394170 [Durotheca rogersii]